MKKMEKSMRSNNIIHYILMYYIVAMAIIVMLGGYLYYSLFKTVYSDFIEENERVLYAIVNRHESDMQIMDDIVTQMGLVDDYTKFCLEYQIGKEKDLMHRIEGYTAVSQFFELLFYYWQGDNYMYHHSSSVDINFFLETGCFFEKQTEKEFNEQLLCIDNRMSIFPEQIVYGDWIKSYLIKSDEYVVCFRKIPPTNEESLIFFIPNAYYSQLLESNVEDKRKIFLYYEGEIIVSEGSADISKEILSEVLLEMELEEWTEVGAVDEKKISVGENDFIVSAYKGKSGICYVSLQDVAVFCGKINAKQGIIILLILISALSITISIYLISGRIVRKIKKINMLLEEDSYYDLKSIENGIQTLILTRKELEMEKNASEKTRFISNFVKGRYANKEEAVERALDAELYINHEMYIVVLFQSNELNNESRVYTILMEMIEKENDMEGYGVHLMKNEQILFVIYGDSKNEILKLVEDFHNILMTQCNNSIVAISGWHKDFSKGAKAYLEADAAFDSHLLIDSSKIIHFSTLIEKNYVNPFQDNCLNQLRYAIRDKDKVTVKTVVKNICDKLNDENVSIYTFKVFYQNIINILLSEWKNKQVRLDNVFDIFAVSQCMNKNDFYDLLCDMCMTIIEHSEDCVFDSSKTVTNAIEYIRENFQNTNLNINSVAEYLEVGTVRLSMEFKKEMNMGPLDYLMNLRIKKAKELLFNSNMKIQEISREVGYEDVHTFIRWFKKYVGVTPKQYRESKDEII